MITLDKNKLSELLKTLKEFPQLREVKSLRKRLEKEEQKIIPKIRVIEKQIISANVRRSTKLQRYWRYVKLIRDNFPDLKTNKIRSQLKQRQQGQQVDIPDAVWQNPSPKMK